MKEKHLLLVHFESGDEINLTVVPFLLLDDITKFTEKGQHNTMEEVDKILGLIYENRVATLMLQSYVLESYEVISKYNIAGAIHLPEIGC